MSGPASTGNLMHLNSIFHSIFHSAFHIFVVSPSRLANGVHPLSGGRHIAN